MFFGRLHYMRLLTASERLQAALLLCLPCVLLVAVSKDVGTPLDVQDPGG